MCCVYAVRAVTCTAVLGAYLLAPKYVARRTELLSAHCADYTTRRSFGSRVMSHNHMRIAQAHIQAIARNDGTIQSRCVLLPVAVTFPRRLFRHCTHTLLHRGSTAIYPDAVSAMPQA